MSTPISFFRPNAWQELCRHLYSALLLLLIPVAFINLLVRGYSRQIEYAQRKRERFGILPANLEKGGYLIHCVSVGEVVAAAPVVKAIKSKQPNLTITITTTTPTGSQRVQDVFGDSVQHFYLPYDVPLFMRRLLTGLKPTKVCVTEVELWPNFVHHCWRRDIPVFVINARMTDRSMQRYQKFPALFEPMLHKLSCVCAQGQRDWDNYLQLGVQTERLVLTNNIKFELNLNKQLQDAVNDFAKHLQLANRPVWVAASTHDPEESVVLETHSELLKQYPELLLILVPRHPQRFTAVAELLTDKQLNFVRSAEKRPLEASTQVLLVDEMGRLNAAYGLANFAFVGGSIADKGGHNALEAALFSIPSMMGYHTYNNPEICQLLQDAGGLVSVQNATDMLKCIRHWLEQPALLKNAGESAKQVIVDNSGALERTLVQIFK